jgi:SAM-dependent methyltransferase
MMRADGLTAWLESSRTAESWSERRERIAAFYGDLLERHAEGPQACDYRCRETQQARFEILCQVMPLRGRRVLDVGCGFADFADYLMARHGPLTYEGVDVTPRMVELARRRHPALSLRVLDILHEDPGGPYDLVTANGIFYLLGEDPEPHMQRLIARMYQLTSNAVAFTSLSAWASRKDPGEFYADPLATVEFCRTVTPWVVLRHDYLPQDFTIYLHRRAP